jgi:CRP/FNR family transcriptional regulator, cyclic AMP receptor protein
MSSSSAHKMSRAGLDRLALAVLSQSELTQSCPPAVWDTLLKAGQIEHCVDQTYLCHVGDPLPDLLMVLEGNLEASRVGAGGKRHIVVYMVVGQLVGLLTIIDRKGSPQDIRCHGDVTLLRVPMEVIRRLYAESPEFQQAVVTLICLRSRAAYDALSAQVLLSLNARAAYALVWLVSVHGLSHGERRVIKLRISQTAIADQLGVARQSLNRELKLLERKGVLLLGKAQIEILDLPALQHLAAGGE